MCVCASRVRSVGKLINGSLSAASRRAGVNTVQADEYTDVEISVAEVGLQLAAGAGEVAVRDVWRRAPAGKSVGGLVRVTVPPRDSALLLLTPLV